MSQTIVVYNSEELEAAYTTLSTSAEGGTIQLAASAESYLIDFNGYGSDLVEAPVTITNADPDNPAVIGYTKLSWVSNVTFDGVTFYAEGDDIPDHQQLVRMREVENVTIRNSSLSSNGEGVLGVEGEAAVEGASLLGFRTSTGLVFENNVVSGGIHGLTLDESSDITISDNEFYGIQADGIRMVAVQDVEISNNYMHDFIGTTLDVNHPDYIQIWGTGAESNSSDVTISNNVIDTGDGQFYQGIFGHNEDYEENGWRFENFVIEENVIFASGYHMISLGDTSGMIVRNNSVLYNQDAERAETDGTWTEMDAGWIRAVDSDTTIISNNMAASFYDNGVADDTNIVTTISEQYLIYVNLYAGGSGDLRDLQIEGNDPIYDGVGASLLHMADTSADLMGFGLVSTSGDTLFAVAAPEITSVDKSVVTLDAGYSRNVDGFIDDLATVTWTFEDGTQLTGQRVTYDFGTAGVHSYTLRVENAAGEYDEITRTIEIDEATPLVLGSDGTTIINTAHPETEITVTSGVTLTSTGFITGVGDSVLIDNDTQFLFEQDAFEYELTLRPIEGTSGVIFMIHTMLRATLEPDGSIKVWVETQDGYFEVQTAANIFTAAGETRQLNVRYDSAAQILEILVDGELRASGTVTGRTQAGSHYGLSFGDNYGDDFQAEFSDVSMSVQYKDGLDTVGLPPADSSASIVMPEGAVFLTDFEGGQEMQQMTLTDGALVAGIDGTALDLTLGGRYLREFDDGTLFESDGFSLSFDLQLGAGDASGYMLHLYQKMVMLLREDGRISFEMQTADGTFTAVSEQGLLADGAVHQVTFDYDAGAGEMRILVDGVIVGVQSASGLTGAAASHDLYFGHTFDDALDLAALLDNFQISSSRDDSASQSPTYAAAGDHRITLDFEGDAYNDVANTIETAVTRGALDYVTGSTGSMAVFDRGDAVTVDKDISEMYGHDAFVFEMDLSLSDDGMHYILYQHMGMRLTSNGGVLSFAFEDETDTEYSVSSAAAVLEVEKVHHIMVAYSDAADTLALYVDGVEVGSTYATGSAFEVESWGFQIGGPSWKGGFAGTMDNFDFTVADLFL